MGYMSNGLTFRTLQAANIVRLPLFKIANGKKADHGNWKFSDWVLAVVGELGEMANVLKKVNRGDFTLEEARPQLSQEIADVVIYLDILASKLGINLGAAVIQTWNAKSSQLKIPVYIDAEDWHYSRVLSEDESATVQLSIKNHPY